MEGPSPLPGGGAQTFISVAFKFITSATQGRREGLPRPGAKSNFCGPLELVPPSSVPAPPRPPETLYKELKSKNYLFTLPNAPLTVWRSLSNFIFNEFFFNVFRLKYFFRPFLRPHCLYAKLKKKSLHFVVCAQARIQETFLEGARPIPEIFLILKTYANSALRTLKRYRYIYIYFLIYVNRVMYCRSDN